MTAISFVFCMAVTSTRSISQLFDLDSVGGRALPKRFGRQQGGDTGATAGGGDQQGLDWLRDALPGEPGVDYPIYSLPTPQTSFDCSDKV